MATERVYYGFFDVFVTYPTVRGVTRKCLECVDLGKLSHALADAHGSGFDTDYHVHVSRNGNVHVRTEYHATDENGCYNGWRPINLYLRRATSDKVIPLRGPCEGQTQTLYKRGDIIARVRCAADMEYEGDVMADVARAVGAVWVD